ncbi:NACHT, LRR and PYD domains-containing 12 [Paramuricea clavata]|uniref:NACHT, LRR and PYD domains-containing 12 n=1 Tax=Paramuricea clavata TaxID=317549 RepID=A0A7D9DJI4_PARCT|nr:NACHT, LRR and PYD domains-containing 12 [Paramuricea clavata]
MLGSNLKWNTQVDDKTKKACKRLYALRVLKKAGLQERELVLVYKSMIRPILEYAVEAWSDFPQYLSDKLERVQKRALWIIYPGSDYGEALKISKLESHKDRRVDLCKKYINKLKDPSHTLHHLTKTYYTNTHGYNLRSGNQNQIGDFGLSALYLQTKERRRQALNENVCKLSVKREEIETIDKLKSEVEMVNKEFDDFKVKYNDLEKQKNALYEEIILEVNNLKEEEKPFLKLALNGKGPESFDILKMRLSLLQWDKKVMSSESNRTVAIINGPEYYETLKASLPNLFNKINGLIKTGSILINGEYVKLEFFLGGDLKFLLMIIGMDAASSKYACLWCLANKDDRWDTSKNLNYYYDGPKCRTLEDILKHFQCKSGNLGCINKPLLDIDLDHVVPDELHLLLRVTFRLLKNVVEEVMENDLVNDYNMPKGQPSGVGLTSLVEAINECGVPINKVW